MVFRILTAAFQQRRKMMRQSLKGERSPALPCLAFSFLSIYPLPFTSLLLTRVLLSPLEFHFLSYLNSSLFACIHSNPCLDFILYIPSHLSWSLPPICLPAYLPACLPACLSLLLPLWIWLSKGFKHHANCGYIMFWIMWDVHVLNHVRCTCFGMTTYPSLTSIHFYSLYRSSESRKACIEWAMGH